MGKQSKFRNWFEKKKKQFFILNVKVTRYFTSYLKKVIDYVTHVYTVSYVINDLYIYI